MRKKSGKLFMGILVAVVALGIGYAAITAIPLVINGSATAKASGNQEDFDVHFNDFTNGNNYLTYTETVGNTGALSQTLISGKKVEGTFSESTKKVTAEIDSTDTTKADITIDDLENVGDTFTVKIPVVNASNGISADLSVDVTNNNEEYFTVTSTVDNDSIAANGTTYVNVVVTVVKVPKVNDVTGTFTVDLSADPTE